MNFVEKKFNKWSNNPGVSKWEKCLFAFARHIVKYLMRREIINDRGNVNTWLINGNATISETSHCAPMHHYEQLVCLTGFGHSGSGAVGDLLSEYSNVTSNVYADKNGSVRNNVSQCVEFDILRHMGGLFSLEDVLTRGNIFQQDACLRMFLSLMKHHFEKQGGFYGMSKKVINVFIEELIEFKAQTSYGWEFCPHLKTIDFDGCLEEGKSKHLFFCKKLSVHEYRCIARRFISSLLRDIESKEFLVLDQIVSDGSGDIEKYQEYLGSIKLLAVIRDPRDVFVTGIMRNEFWIPHDAHNFIYWYQRQVEKYINLSNSNYMMVRFEDIVLDYSQSVKCIEDFLGLKQENHIARFSAFDPSVSIKNVGIWKNYHNRSTIDLIGEKLQRFCVN
jgi:hypothetical protein